MKCDPETGSIGADCLPQDLATTLVLGEEHSNWQWVNAGGSKHQKEICCCDLTGNLIAVWCLHRSKRKDSKIEYVYVYVVYLCLRAEML